MKNERNKLFENRRRGIATTPVVVVCCGLATTVALGLLMSERGQMQALNRERTQTAAALDQAKLQIQDLANRLKTLTEKSVATPERAETAEPAPVPTEPRTAAPRTASPASRKRPVRAVITVDRRLDRLQGQLSETQKALASTREELASTREQSGRDKAELDGKINSTREQSGRDKAELDGKIDSTRNDLNGSIARTHDEVVALQKRGELNIYEFKLIKSKEMQRVGPLSISLRNANAKRKAYDLTMMVDDNVLTKRNVNLYEPVWITLGDRPQPVQLVVNHVEKNEIEGYLSEPKYRKSQLQANSGQQAPQPQLSSRGQNTTNQ
jgi:hypothetical protein